MELVCRHIWLWDDFFLSVLWKSQKTAVKRPHLNVDSKCHIALYREPLRFDVIRPKVDRLRHQLSKASCPVHLRLRHYLLRATAQHHVWAVCLDWRPWRAQQALPEQVLFKADLSSPVPVNQLRHYLDLRLHETPFLVNRWWLWLQHATSCVVRPYFLLPNERSQRLGFPNVTTWTN